MKFSPLPPQIDGALKIINRDRVDPFLGVNSDLPFASPIRTTTIPIETLEFGDPVLGIRFCYSAEQDTLYYEPRRHLKAVALHENFVTPLQRWSRDSEQIYADMRSGSAKKRRAARREMKRLAADITVKMELANRFTRYR